MYKGLLSGAAFFLAAGLAVSTAVTAGANDNPVSQEGPSALSAEHELVQAAERVQQATVAVLKLPATMDRPENYIDRMQTYIKGSGFHLRDGYIMTARHVAEDTVNGEEVLNPEITILTRNQDEVKATLVGASELLDIAVYRIDSKRLTSPLPEMAFASDEPPSGSKVFTVGFPLGWGPAFTFGEIGNTSTFLPIRNSMRLVQISMPEACSGNSGGGLFNSRGEIVGMMRAIIQVTRSCGSKAYSTPANIMRRVTEDIIQGKETRLALLGVGMAPVKLRDAWRVAVSGVSGPALEAGIKPGDILLSIGDTPILSADQLKSHIIEKTRPGQKSQVKVLRGNDEKTFTVTMGVQ